MRSAEREAEGDSESSERGTVSRSSGGIEAAERQRAERTELGRSPAQYAGRLVAARERLLTERGEWDPV